jgi:hypothetical protein
MLERPILKIILKWTFYKQTKLVVKKTLIHALNPSKEMQPKMKFKVCRVTIEEWGVLEISAHPR